MLQLHHAYCFINCLNGPWDDAWQKVHMTSYIDFYCLWFHFNILFEMWNWAHSGPTEMPSLHNTNHCVEPFYTTHPLQTKVKYPKHSVSCVYLKNILFWNFGYILLLLVQVWMKALGDMTEKGLGRSSGAGCSGRRKFLRKKGGPANQKSIVK